jgi:hypothetical protein
MLYRRRRCCRQATTRAARLSGDGIDQCLISGIGSPPKSIGKILLNMLLVESLAPPANPGIGHDLDPMILHVRN